MVDDFQKHGSIDVEWKKPKVTRTNQQNRALHKDFANVAIICQHNNVTADKLFRLGNYDMPVTADLVKEFWHCVIDNMGLQPHEKKKKTSKLSPKEVNDIRAGIEMAFAKKWAVDIGDFPSLESLSEAQR
jgi:hypothetical protein